MTAVAMPLTEAALAARWGAGEFVGRWLRTAAGDALMVLFAGRPGGPSGPDFRDAVLARPDGARLYGDVELHLRARGWQAHGHACDPHYARVVLHVVARADGAQATRLVSGQWAALVELGIAPAPSRTGAASASVLPWPCAEPDRSLSPPELAVLLQHAGRERFAQHTAAFVEQLAAAERRDGGSGWRATDRVLFAALAEGLTYGRDRAALRRAGEWLASGGAPEALLRQMPRLPVLDATRLEGLLTLRAHWEATGPWAAMLALLAAAPQAEATATANAAPAGGRSGQPAHQPARDQVDGAPPRRLADRLIAALSVPGGVISPRRAAILVANAVLPLAAAWALRHDDAALGARARAVYSSLPGLPSNQITRAMIRQLGLSRSPAGACAQQGLQHLWAQHCREKQCGSCPCAGPAAPPTPPLPRGIYCEA